MRVWRLEKPEKFAGKLAIWAVVGNFSDTDRDDA